ncbi:MAG: UDP-N-acetylglucosamine-1-phosphate transferase [Thaumarchaeota archaeon]|nr:UDP-N-acetylglucosamine-1-phosphate transferase [Nitrososphaerota archaeon]|tara:strand:- start:10023 stop:11009 length:987 start_codon:yes stop_codon:yes gene_type:complete
MNLGLIEYGVVAMAFIITYLATNRLISLLVGVKREVLDYHKEGKSFVAYPGGPAIIFGLISSLLVSIILTNDIRIIAILGVVIISSTIGIIDDFKSLGGRKKPLLLLLASLPIILLGAYEPNLDFLFFGSAKLSIIYPLLILISIPVTANTINTIDVLNGVSTGFVIITAIPLLISLFLIGDSSMVLVTLILISVCLAFFVFHKYPSKVFPGDSGTLTLGAMYGAIAIVGGVELIGVFAILPAILNSFFYLSSMRDFVEHKNIKVRPTRVLKDGTIEAERNDDAPITLVRLIVAGNPSKELPIVNTIFILSIVSAILATIIGILTWVI